MEITSYSRIELYKLIWSEPMTSLAIKFNITYPELRKICLDRNIPIPPNGHWTKLKFGKPVSIIELPPEPETIDELVPQENILDPKWAIPIKKRLTDEIRNDPNLPNKVPLKLTNPDVLILKAKDTLNNTKSTRYFPFVSTGFDEPNIKVSPECVPRALRIMDAFIKLVRARGHEFTAVYDDSKVTIDDVQTKVFLREKGIRQKDNTSGYTDKIPTGVLVFKTDGYQGNEWHDGKRKIEEQLPDILASIEFRVMELKEHWRINDLRRKEEEAKKLHEEEIRDRKEKELKAFTDLIEQAKRWRKAKTVREYLDQLEISLPKNLTDSPEFRDWNEWAQARLESYDPLSKNGKNFEKYFIEAKDVIRKIKR